MKRPTIDAIREIRTYIFDYDDTERLSLHVWECDKLGVFRVSLEPGDGRPRVSLGAFEKRPSLRRLVRLARDHAELLNLTKRKDAA